MSNFGVPNGTDVIFTSREAALAANRRAIGINVGGVAAGTEVVTRGEPVDRPAAYGVFKAALMKAHAEPKVLKSSEPVVISNPTALAKDITSKIMNDAFVLDLIKSAHSDGVAWDPFSEDQNSAKALRKNVGIGETGETFTEGGRKLVRINKVA